jgi:hypothetical protein
MQARNRNPDQVVDSLPSTDLPAALPVVKIFLREDAVPLQDPIALPDHRKSR